MGFRAAVFSALYWYYSQTLETEKEILMTKAVLSTFVLQFLAILSSWWASHTPQTPKRVQSAKPLQKRHRHNKKTHKSHKKENRPISGSFSVKSIPLSLSLSCFAITMTLPYGPGRGLQFYLSFTYFLRVFEIVVLEIYANESKFRERMLHMVSPVVDVFGREDYSTKPRERQIKIRWILAETAFMLTLMFLSLSLLWERVYLQLNLWLVSFIGGVFILSILTLEGLVVELAFMLFDQSLPMKLMVYPILATTVRDFWSKRWNRGVHCFLKRYIYSPLKRMHCSTALATFASFFASAMYHVIPLMVAGEKHTDVSSLWLFFTIEALAMTLESLLRVYHWPKLLGWVWTFTWCVAPIPLFVTPYFGLIHVEMVPSSDLERAGS